MGKVKIAPSILAANFADLKGEVESINNSSAELLHIDIMDGIFVPNISFGFPVTNAINRHSQKPLDFHLMIQHPDHYLTHCKESGAQIISVHYEVCPHLHRTIGAIKDLGLKAGVALNPHTPVTVLGDILADIDVALLMSVNPGFGGQIFIENTYNKIRELRKLASDINIDLEIEIDGGVTLENSSKLIDAGANILVAGSSVFKETDRSAIVDQLRKA